MVNEGNERDDGKLRWLCGEKSTRGKTAKAKTIKQLNRDYTQCQYDGNKRKNSKQHNKINNNNSSHNALFTLYLYLTLSDQCVYILRFAIA